MVAIILIKIKSGAAVTASSDSLANVSEFKITELEEINQPVDHIKLKSRKDISSK
jgi:hypothetical protein